MSDVELRIGGQPIDPAEGWEVRWLDAERRLARATHPNAGALTAVVEGSGSDWQVTLRGRRIAVSVRTWRERVLAEAESAARAHGGPIEVKATLPGLVVAVRVEAGAEVAAGDPLLTIEAMKMQNEVRAPRDGHVTAVAVAPGQAVATGALLLRLE